jgi:hypothetical protein
MMKIEEPPKGTIILLKQIKLIHQQQKIVLHICSETGKMLRIKFSVQVNYMNNIKTIVQQIIWPTASLYECDDRLVVIDRYTHKRHYVTQLSEDTCSVDGLIIKLEDKKLE